MFIEAAQLTWRDGLPYSSVFDDIYFSLENGLAETQYVFLQGNQLAERFAQLPPQHSFTIAETGFGTGLNFLATWQLWQQSQTANNTWLHFVSVEKHPLSHQDLSRALALWPELAVYAEQLLAQYPPLTAGWHRLCFAKQRITLTLIFGEANELLADLVAKVDAWFLDGFAPDKNPNLWQLDLLKVVAQLSQQGTTLATFSAAGVVRRSLQELGFEVKKQKGFGRKREMITASMPTTTHQPSAWHNPAPCYHGQQQAVIIGAGIAGVSCARALATRGWQVTIIDKADNAMQAASGNPAAIIYPKLAPAHLSAWHFQQQAYLWLLNLLKTDDYQHIWCQTGLLWLLVGNQLREGAKLNDHPWPTDLVQRVSPQQASELAGVNIDCECLFFPQAGFLHPQALAQTWLNHPNITCLWQHDVADIRYQNNQWLILDPQQQTICQAPVVIISNALAAQQLTPTAHLPLTPVRGQIAHFTTETPLQQLKTVLCYGGYLTPAYGQSPQRHCLGASFWPRNKDSQVTDEDHQHNYDLLQQFLPHLAEQLPSIDTWQGRAALRAQTSDYLPMVGALPVYEDFIERYAAFKHGRTVNEAPNYHQGLYVSLGHGSKGFCYAPLAAEVIAAQLNNEPMPIAKRVLEALHPARFWVKQIKRQR